MTLEEIFKKEFCESCEREDSCGEECLKNAIQAVKDRVKEIELSEAGIRRILSNQVWDTERGYVKMPRHQYEALAQTIHTEISKKMEEL